MQLQELAPVKGPVAEKTIEKTSPKQKVVVWEAFDVTGFYYEPWHFRYVGVELATELYETGNFLAQYLLDTQPLPCIP